MKFLVLALCVCAASAASAASVGQYKSSNVHKTAKVGASSFAAPPFAPEVNAEVRQSAVAKNAHSDAEAVVVSSESKINDDGTFKNRFETDNGIEIQASGDLKKVGDANVVVLSGSYRYIDADGTPFELTYVADENGYNAKSASLPVAPPVPEDIARAVDYVRKYGKPENDKY